ncbi:LysM peptidoglycan-binding domain-containing protein, partial [Neisseria sp. P0015.S002]
QGNAAEVIRSTIARLEEDEARAAKARLAKAKQQERTQARLARALQQQQTLASGTHRVTDGDTMYNISQRYNISVADLATIN